MSRCLCSGECLGPRLPHLEDGDPGIADVVEVDGALEGVVLPRGAVGVVLVPVDTGGVAGAVVGLVVQATGWPTAPLPSKGGHTPAGPHAVLPRLGADEGVLVLILGLVIALQVHTQGAAEGTGMRLRAASPGKKPRKGEVGEGTGSCRVSRAGSRVGPAPGRRRDLCVWMGSVRTECETPESRCWKVTSWSNGFPRWLHARRTEGLLKISTPRLNPRPMKSE